MHRTMKRRPAFVLPREIFRASAKSVVLVALVLVLAGVARADWISVQNAGFESPDLPDGIWTGSIPDWEFASAPNGAGGVFNPPSSRFSGQAPEGQNVAWSANREIFQTLNDVLLADTEYTLQVKVGDALYSAYDGYEIRLYAYHDATTRVLLAEDNTTATPADGTFETATLSFTTGSSHAELGQQLQISLFANQGTNPTSQAYFDDVRLDATTIPEPTCVVGLLSMLLVGLVGYVWRRRGIR